jgi:hypothetical protein
VRIGHLDGDLFDPRCAWLRRREIARDGAILVRPDRFVAWRERTASDDPSAALAAALDQILARPHRAGRGRRRHHDPGLHPMTETPVIARGSTTSTSRRPACTR